MRRLQEASSYLVSEAQLEVPQAVLLVLLIALFTVLFAVAIAVMAHALATTPRWGFAKVLKCMLPWPVLARDVDMVAGAGHAYLTADIPAQDVGAIVLGGLPGYLLFSTYLLLAFFWVLLYHGAAEAAARARLLRRLRAAYLATNAAVYGVYGALVALMLALPARLQQLHAVEGVYAASLSLLVAAGVCLYGARLLCRMGHSVSVPGAVRRIQLLTAICTAAFTLRSVIILLGQFVFDTPLLNLLSATTNEVFCEALPTALILLFLCVPPRAGSATYAAL